MKENDYKIIRNPRGYYSLYICGQFYGNYDSVREAEMDLEEAV